VGRLARTLNAMLDRLQAAFEERRASEARLRRFVADASHELQTPLTSVRGYAELFRRGAARDPDDLDMAMARIEAEATRMGVLVDDLLTLARLDQGRELRREPVDLVPLARDLVHDARVVDPGRPIDLEADGSVVVAGDDPALRQVLGNLIANARVHTPPGTPVTVRVRARDAMAVVEVADRGPGLAPEHAERVFERFFRADPSRARASGGTGLGLSIVAAVAEAHGGSAEVDSAPGRGATFRIVLPLAGEPTAHS
jgi:two-component system OmpR family sensor kinase